MKQGKWTYQDFTVMDNYNGESERELWELRAVLIATDRYPAMAYTPPVPMEIESLYILRRN